MFWKKSNKTDGKGERWRQVSEVKPKGIYQQELARHASHAAYTPLLGAAAYALLTQHHVAVYIVPTNLPQADRPTLGWLNPWHSLF